MILSLGGHHVSGALCTGYSPAKMLHQYKNEYNFIFGIKDIRCGKLERRMAFANARRQSLSLLLRRSATRHRDKIALICGSESLSYAALDDLADSLARGLLD
ncbi:MAG TPA: hypothetical protein VJM09_12280, partial [Sphingobium sp.]|nr:hypothetical protein [Sphingobium sp.]